MRKLKIEKYVNGRLDESFTVPLGFIRFLGAMLPRSVIDAMSKNGIDLERIVFSATRNEPYQNTVECEEKGVMKQIILALTV